MFKKIFKKKELKFNINNIKSQSILDALLINKKDVNIKKYYNDDVEKDKPLITIENLCKKFSKNGKLVLKNINLKIYESQNIALLGANGAGKTTLVETISGLNKQTSGKITYHYDYNKNFQEKIGIQFQDSLYPPAITVCEVMKFMIGIYGININNDELLALLNIFGIDQYYNKKASKLSGGQQQRFNALLSIIHKPKILFLDELSTGLDINIKTNIKSFIKNFAKENNITIIIISHDMDEVEFLADQICVMKDGEIIVNDKKDNILKKYNKLETFMIPYL